jgi:predicted house-cleaning noncanonical NTP pyrophosphatase (MazG superfamily)
MKSNDAKPDSRPRLVKLVRDRVASVVDTNFVEYQPIEDREEAIQALRAKLVEEAVEYLLNPSLGELADALAVIDALLVHDLGFSPVRGKIALQRERDSKRRERGEFDDLVGMFVSTTAPTRHEGGK